MNKRLRFLCLLLISILCHLQRSSAQSDLSSDALFQQARTTAFDHKDYPAAISLSKQALEKAPDYSDIRIFLGRLYTWSNHPDSAVQAFKYVLNAHPDNEDAASAYTDLLYWNDKYNEALVVCNQGLSYHPKSEELLLKKAKILAALEDFKTANSLADSILVINPKNDQVRSLINSIKEQSSLDKIGISYDYVNFDKQFSDPWHLVSISYAHHTKIGSLIGRINYANRFATSGVQGEIDFYPHISKTFYAYLNTGISGTNSVFPRFRTGASLYANLPWSSEAEAGVRYLKFSSDVWMYTASLGKYYKNFWFNLRTFLVPASEKISQSFTLTTRYYTGGADDYFYLALGTGVSPDDRSSTPLLGIDEKLRSQKIGAGLSQSFHKRNIITFDATWYHQQFLTNTYGNQWDLGISYYRRL